MVKLGAKELRKTDPTTSDLTSINHNPIWIIVDNVLDTYNVGAISRLADAVAAEKVYLCGETLAPPNHKIKKASVDTWKWVEWEYAETAMSAISNLKTQISNLKVVAIEQDSRSVPFQEASYEFPIAFVVGHESDGVSKAVLDIADTIVELPMYGVNKSLNVMVSLGIVLYQAVQEIPGEITQNSS